MKNPKSKNKNKVVQNSKTKKSTTRFIVSREYAGTSTFSELFEPIVEMMVKNDINQKISEISGISDF